MAEYCINCNKKISAFGLLPFYVQEGKPLCAQCSKPIAVCFDKAFLAEDTEEELITICKDTYKEEVATLIIETYREKRKKHGFMVQEETKEWEQLLDNVLMTTTSNLEGYKIVKYVDIVTEEVVFKNSFLKSLSASLDDFGNVMSFKQSEMTGASELIANARKYVLRKVKGKVINLGANAIIGMDFESSFGSDIVKVAVFGTVVIAEKIE